MINKRLGFWLIVGMAVFMPIESVMVGSLGLTDLFIALLILVSWPALWRMRTRARLHFPLVLPMWLIWTGSLIATLSVVDMSTALFTMFQDVYLVVLLMTLVNVITEEGTFQKILKVWAVVSTVEAGLLLLDHAGLHLPLLSSGGKLAIATAHGKTLAQAISDLGRAIGTFSNANAAGGYMMISLFFLLSIPFPRNRLVRLGLIGLHLLGIVVTGSNSALAATAVGLAIVGLFWLHHLKGRPLLFSAGWLMVLVVVVTVTVPVILPLVGTVDRSNLLYNYSHIGDKVGKRLDLWNQAVNNLSLHPLGIGPNVARTVDTKGLHDDYIASLSERGPLGFVGLLALIGELLFCLVLAATRGRRPHQRQMSGALLAAVVGLFIMAAVHEVFHGRPAWVLWAFIFLHYKFIRAQQAQPVPQLGFAPASALAQAAPGD